MHSHMVLNSTEASISSLGSGQGTGPIWLEVELDRELYYVAPWLSVTASKFGVFSFPVVPSKPRFRLVPLNDHNGWLRKLYPLASHGGPVNPGRNVAGKKNGATP